jgi:hypothetical protein
MRVICRTNLAARLAANYLDLRAGLAQSFVFPLTVSQSYVVYGLLLRDNQVWYLVADDNDLPYPMAYPAPLFEVQNGRPSQHWVFALTPDSSVHHALLAAPAWTDDAYFYDRLTNGDESAVREFDRMRALMDEEEAASTVKSPPPR